jgi:hypothetical protein
MVTPEINRRRAVFVLGRIDEILSWEKTKEQEKDVRFVELGEYLCEVRAKQYWRLEKLKSFDEFLEKRFADSRRKAYYLMTIHEHLTRFLEQRGLSYIIVARLTLWLKREAARVTTWRALGEHYAAGEFHLQLFGWDRPRRFVVIREQLRAERPSLGRKLLDVPGYTFRVFVTNLALPPEELWRDYNRRADMENRIAELKHDLAADDFCLQEFFATEAAFRSILLLFNLLGEFQRACGLPSYRQPATLRAQVFLCGALLGRAGRRLVLHLSASWGGLQQRILLLENVLTYGVPTSPKLHPGPPT